MPLIYCVEDDEGVLELLLCAIKTGGFEGFGFEDGEKFFSAIKIKKPDMVILDVMLPKMDGIEIIKMLKQNPSTNKIPVIFLTAKQTEIDKVSGLEAGADDYMVKPFGVMEFLSRVKAVLRRTTSTDKSALIFELGGIVIDTEKHTIYYKDKLLNSLTNKEFELLLYLIKNSKIVITRDKLIEKVWGYDYFGESRTVDVHIRMLRQKLFNVGCPEYIKTIRGVGYKFEV